MIGLTSPAYDRGVLQVVLGSTGSLPQDKTNVMTNADMMIAIFFILIF
jgi:hypothetical protein